MSTSDYREEEPLLQISPSRARLLRKSYDNDDKAHSLPPQNIFKEPETSIWKTMMVDYYNERQEIEEFKEKKNPKPMDYRFPEGSTVEYMENKLFSVLFPALTTALIEAVRTNSLTNMQSIFDPLDKIAELLWNKNPNFPQRAAKNMNIHDMPWAQKILKEKPRPYFPKSWIYSPEIAAKTIQAFYRGYLVRKREDVQEMRQFWQAIQIDKIKSKPELHVKSSNFRQFKP